MIDAYHLEAVEVLRDLSSQGVELDVQGDRVHYLIPAGLPADEIKTRIRWLKPHLLELWDTPIVRRRAPRERWCSSCQKADERGERIVLCSRCDIPVEPS